MQSCLLMAVRWIKVKVMQFNKQWNCSVFNSVYDNKYFHTRTCPGCCQVHATTLWIVSCVVNVLQKVCNFIFPLNTDTYLEIARRLQPEGGAKSLFPIKHFQTRVAQQTHFLVLFTTCTFAKTWNNISALAGSFSPTLTSAAIAFEAQRVRVWAGSWLTLLFVEPTNSPQQVFSLQTQFSCNVSKTH